MRAAIVEGAGTLVVSQVPMPEMGPYDALVRIKACGICNSTDVKIIERKFVSSIPVPLVLGHESVGTVIDVGSKVRRYELGQQVLRPGATYDYDKVGIASAWGGFAEYGLVTDLTAWLEDHPEGTPVGMWAKQQIVPSEIEPGEATAIITLKETLSAIRAGGIDDSTSTAIVGTGPVARSFTYWAHWLGAPRMVVFGRRERWRQGFLDLGADNYVVGGVSSLQHEGMSMGPGSFDRAIDAVGSSQSLADALALIQDSGLVANYGVAPEDDHETAPLASAREAGRIIDLPVREEDVHDEVIEMVQRGDLQLSTWVSHRLPLERIQEGFRLLAERQAIKVVIDI